MPLRALDPECNTNLFTAFDHFILIEINIVFYEDFVNIALDRLLPVLTL
jgi:hypothetical protein